MKALTALAPDVSLYQQHLAGSLSSLGTLLDDHNNQGEGVRAMQRALEIQDRLTSDNPKKLEYRSELAATLEQSRESLDEPQGLRRLGAGLPQVPRVPSETLGRGPGPADFLERLVRQFEQPWPASLQSPAPDEAGPALTPGAGAAGATGCASTPK